MSLKFGILTIVFLVTVLVYPNFIFAQTQDLVEDTRTVTEIKNVVISDGSIVGEFYAKNRERNSVNDLTYTLILSEMSRGKAVVVGGVTRNISEIGSVLASKEGDNVFSLLPGEEILKKFELKFPNTVKSGQYRLEARVSNLSGRIVGSDIKTVKLNGSGEFLSIDQSSCQLSVGGASYRPNDGPNVYPEEKIKISCNVKNLSSTRIEVKPSVSVSTYFALGYREGNAKLLELSDNFVFSPGEIKNIEIDLIAAADPQTYQAVLQFKKADSEILVSPFSNFRWVVKGEAARIVSIAFDKSSYPNGDDAKVSVSFFVSPDLFWSGRTEPFIVRDPKRFSGTTIKNPIIKTSIFSGGGKLCGDGEIKIKGEISSPNLQGGIVPVVISSNCNDPVASVSISDGDRLLADTNYQTKTPPSQVQKSFFWFLSNLYFWVGAVILAFALWYSHKKGKNKRNALGTTLLIIGISIIILAFGGYLNTPVFATGVRVTFEDTNGGPKGDCPRDPHCISYGDITSVKPHTYMEGTKAFVDLGVAFGSINSCGNIYFNIKVDVYLDGSVAPVYSKDYGVISSGQYTDSYRISTVGLLPGTHQLKAVFMERATHTAFVDYIYFTITPQPSDPVGFHEGSTCLQSVGWACDPNNFAQPLQIDFYDGPGFGKPLGSITADYERGFSIGEACGTFAAIGLASYKHGFDFATPASIKDGITHSIYAYAKNIGLGSDKLLSGSPRGITCPTQTTRCSGLNPMVDFAWHDDGYGGGVTCTSVKIEVNGTIITTGQSCAGMHTWDASATTSPTYNFAIRYASGLEPGGEFSKTVDSAGIVGTFTSIKATDDNSIYMSYYDGTGKNLKFAKSTDGGATWPTIRTVDTTIGDIGKYSSIDVSGTNVYISYYDGTGKNLKFAKSTDRGLTWPLANIKAVDTLVDKGAFSSIAVSGSNVYISYYDGTYKDLRFARSTNDGVSWLTTNRKKVDGKGDVGLYTSIAAEGSNVYISYYDNTATKKNLKFARSTNGGATWTPGNIKSVDTPGKVGTFSSIAVSGSNVYISYYDGTGKNLKFAKSTDSGLTWPLANIKAVDTLGDVGQHTSIEAVGSDVFISYYDVTNKALKLARSLDGGTTWPAGNVRMLESKGTIGQYSSISVPNTNKVFIGYYVQTLSDLKFYSITYLESLNYPLPTTGHAIEEGSLDAPICLPPAATADIKANKPGDPPSNGPVSIPYNTNAIVSWTSTNANSCSVSPCPPGAGGSCTDLNNNAGKSTNNLISSQTYTLTCMGSGGNPPPDSVTIVIPPPPDYSLSANPSSILATIIGSGLTISTKTIITGSSISNYRGDVNLTADVSSIPVLGVTYTFNDPPDNGKIPIPSGGSATSEFTVSIPANTPANPPESPYQIIIQGNDGINTQRITTVLLNVVLKDPGFKEVMKPVFEAFANFISPLVQTSHAAY